MIMKPLPFDAEETHGQLPPATAHMNAGRHQDWSTPPDLIEVLVDRFGEFYWDVCATYHNTVVEGRYYVFTNGLSADWPEGERMFCNPPFRYTRKWVAKALKMRNESDVETVVVSKQACDTAWWHGVADELETYLLTPRVDYIPPPGVEKSSNNYGTMIMHIGGWANPGAIRRWAWK
jgi:phage N-6-adenine-methyltransferase